MYISLVLLFGILYMTLHLDDTHMFIVGPTKRKLSTFNTRHHLLNRIIGRGLPEMEKGEKE